MNDLKNLTARLEKLKKKKAIDKENIEKKTSINYSIAVNISIELVTGIALGVFFGLIIDNYLQTKPLMLIIFFIIGTLVGFYNMYKTLKKYKFF
jgi:ATP synthase protein I